MSEGTDAVTLNRMKGAVGSLLFLRSGIEWSLCLAIPTELFRDAPKPVRGISRSLDVWSEQVGQAGAGRPLHKELCQRLVGHLRQALAVRNLVCHGLIGSSAEVPRRSQEAHLLVELGEDRRVIAWDELQTMFRWMSRSGWLIGSLTQAAMEKDAAASERSLRGWEGLPERL
jgi:hypothetical protein